MSVRRAFSSLALSLVTAALPVRAEPEDVKRDFVIGIAAPLGSKVSADWGAQIRDAGHVMRDIINAAGGIVGRKVRIAVVDDAGDARQAVNAANKLISDEHPDLVIGHGASNTTKVAKPFYEEAGIPFLMLGNADELTAKPSPQAVRALPSAANYAKAMAAIVRAKGPVGAPIFILSDSSDYGKSLRDDLSPLLPSARHATIVPEDKDMSAIVSMMQAAGAQVVVLAVGPTTAAAIVRQSAAVGFHPALTVGSGVLTYPAFAQNNPAAAEVDIVAIPGCDRETLDRNPRLAALNAAFVAHGQALTDGGLAVASVLDVVRQAVTLNGNGDAKALMARLHDTAFPTAAGTMRWDAAGNLVDPVLVDCRWNRAGSRMVQVGPQP